MITTLWLIAVFGASVLLVGLLCDGLGRRIPRPMLTAFTLLPLLVLAPTFLPGRTILPTHDIANFQPWASAARFRPANPYLNDAITQMVPWHEAVRRAYRSGTLPFWNRWNGCGLPLAANGQSAAFSPLTFVMFLLPIGAAFTWLAAFKIFLAAAGMWLWLRELEIRSEAATFGAVSFALSFSMVTLLLFPVTTVVCLWPWVLFLIECQRDRSLGRKRFVALIAVFVVLVLAGHPESVALGVVFAGLWIVLRRLSGGIGNIRAVLGRTVLAGIAAACLTAFFLLPFASALRASNRNALTSPYVSALTFRWHRPLYPVAAVTSIFPRAFGDRIRMKALPGAGIGFPESVLGYFGVVGSAAALMGLAGVRSTRPERMALAILGLTGLSIGALAWPFADVHDVTPLLRLVPPLRFLSWTALAGSGLAAFGLDRLFGKAARGQSELTRPMIAVGVVGAACIAIFAANFRGHQVTGGRRAFALELIRDLVALTLLALLVLLLGRFRSSLRDASIAWAFPALAALQLSIAMSGFYAGQDVRGLFPPGPLTRFLATQPGLDRAIGRGGSMFPNMNIFADVEDIRTHDPMERRDYVDFLDREAGYPPASYFKMLGNLNAPVLGQLGVRFLISSAGVESPGPRWDEVYSGDDGVVYENRDVKPRVFSTESSAHLHISSLVETTNALSFDASVVGAAPLAVTISTVQDGGWRARSLLTGAALACRRPPGSPLISMTLPPGESRIVLQYSPPGFAAGAGISLGTMIALCLVVMRSRTSAANHTATDVLFLRWRKSDKIRSLEGAS